MNNNLPISGIILSGGKSSRMGQEKGLVKLGDRTLIEYAIDCLKPICSDLIICANADDYLQFGYPVVKDIYPEIGPVSGVYSGLKNSKTSINLVLSCDMPFMRTDLFRKMISLYENSIVVPEHKGMLEPLAAIYPISALISVQDMISKQNYKLRNLFDVEPTLKFQFSEEDFANHEKMFFNVNRPHDINEAAKFI